MKLKNSLALLAERDGGVRRCGVIMTIIALRFPFLFLFGGGGRGEGMTFDRVIYLCGEAGGGGKRRIDSGTLSFLLPERRESGGRGSNN